jgi:hypothetical protein
MQPVGIKKKIKRGKLKNPGQKGNSKTLSKVKGKD